MFEQALPNKTESNTSNVKDYHITNNWNTDKNFPIP